MAAFDDKQFDVLLSTTIVESGLDIPNANTLIVHRADMPWRFPACPATTLPEPVILKRFFTPLFVFILGILLPFVGVSLADGATPQPLSRQAIRFHGYAITPHLAASTDPRHWENPLEFDPERYRSAPASDQIGKERARAIGFARCPFEKASFPVKDGRNADMSVFSGRSFAPPRCA